MLLMNTQLLTNTNFTYEYYSLLKNNPHHSRIMLITLKLLIISEIHTLLKKESLLLRDTIPGVLTSSGDARL